MRWILLLSTAQAGFWLAGGGVLRLRRQLANAPIGLIPGPNPFAEPPPDASSMPCSPPSRITNGSVGTEIRCEPGQTIALLLFFAGVNRSPSLCSWLDQESTSYRKGRYGWAKKVREASRDSIKRYVSIHKQIRAWGAR